MTDALGLKRVPGQRLNILAFSFFPTNVPPTSGGETRLYELYSALSQNHSVRLISSSWPDRPTRTIRHGTNFRELQVQKSANIHQIYAELGALSSSDADLSGPAVYLAGRQPNEMHQVYFDQYDGVDVIIHDSPFTISYDIMAGADLVPRIYNSYNCETHLYAQMHPDESALPIRELVREAELKLLGCADLVTCCSTEDIELLAGLTSRPVRSILVPNGGIDRRSVRKTDASSGPQALFVGSQHQPNREAARYIASDLAADLPHMTFHVTGHCLPEGVFPENVRRHGFVSEEMKDELLSSCDIALNPMVAGGGSNLKLTEYLSYGIPVLSTRYGVRGLGLTSGTEYLEADREGFAATLSMALADPSNLSEIGEAGRRHFRHALTWSAIAERFAGEISDLGRERRSRAAVPVLALNDYDFSNMRSGGATRIRGLYDQMRHEREVFYVVITDALEWSIDRSTSGITLFRVPKSEDHRAEQARIDGQYHLSAADIVGLYMLPSNFFLVALVAKLKAESACIITDHIYTGGLVGPDDVWIYSSQNHETSLKAEILAGHPSFAVLVDKVRKAEDDAMRRAALVVCVSDDDAAKMVAGRRASVPTLVIPNGVLPPDAADREAAAGLFPAVGDQACLFIGSAHPPNIDACTFLVEELAPALPEIEFHLVGSVSEAFAGRTPPNVRLWGSLDEPHKIALAQAVRLALNPITTGGGSNVKIADYFSLGLPVVSTPFGLRGFPEEVASAVEVTERDGFADAIRRLIATRPERGDATCRERLFDKYLNASALGRSLADAVSSLQVPRRRILFVTYRLTFPPRGGAEEYLLKLIEILARTGRYEIDLVAPDVDVIGDEARFAGTYAAETVPSGPFGLPHVHWARFPLDASRPKGADEKLNRLWEAQAALERALAKGEAGGNEPCLLWGWGAAEETGDVQVRWALAESALFAPSSGRLVISGFAPSPLVASSAYDSSTVLKPRRLEGRFSLELDINPGIFSLRISTALAPENDPRPLSFLAEVIEIDAKAVALDTRSRPLSADADQTIAKLADAALYARRGCSLSDVRGPFSSSLERWIDQNIKGYDLLITHNNVFLPVVKSIEIAHSSNVPSVLVPHAHLDDDYYHFPDMIASVEQASTVLASPSSAVRYLSRFNRAVHYHSPGVDVDDVPTTRDVEAFRSTYSDSEPFVLVLGRKAPAKNYRWVIEAAQKAGLRVVLIGPDDDGAPIADLHVTYLGRQPRSVVRGALGACLFLANLSSSESFGMVILEAWLANRPVVVNSDCAAFRDLVRDGENGLLASRTNLASTMQTLAADGALRNALGRAGFRDARGYDWSVIGKTFEQTCCETIDRHRGQELDT